MKTQTLVASARLASPFSVLVSAGGVPSDIQFMPPGRQKIAPYVSGKTRPMEITVDETYAQVFQRALDTMIAQAKAGHGDAPYTDFNHDDQAASGHPQSFYWGGDDPVTGGVRMKTEWTADAKGALTNGAYARFSPRWVFSKKTLEPLGLQANMGGLVNRAAFKTIAPIVAAAGDEHAWFSGVASASGPSSPDSASSPDADDASQEAFESSDETTGKEGEEAFQAHADAAQKHNKAGELMEADGRQDEYKTHKHLAAHHNALAVKFGKQALEDDASSGSAKSAIREFLAGNSTETNTTMKDEDIATAIAKGVETAVKPLMDKITSFETRNKDEAVARAKGVVQHYVGLGAIEPENTKRIEFWTNQALADEASAKDEMERLPRNRFRQMTGGHDSAALATGAGPEASIRAAAQASAKAAPDQFKSEADAIEAYVKTPQGRDEYQNYRNQIVTGNAGLPQRQIVRS